MKDLTNRELLQQIDLLIDKKIDDKLDKMLDQKLDQKLDEKLDQKLDEKLAPIVATIAANHKITVNYHLEVLKQLATIHQRQDKLRQGLIAAAQAA